MFPSLFEGCNCHLTIKNEGTRDTKWISSQCAFYETTTPLPICANLCTFADKKQRSESKPVFDGFQAFFGGGVGDFGDEVHGIVAKFLFNLQLHASRGMTRNFFQEVHISHLQ